MEKELKPKKVKGRVEVLKAMPYKGVMVYIRRIDGEIFEYIIPYKGQIFSSYLIITPEKGKSKLTGEQVNKSAAVIFTGAVSTVDTLIGEE